MFNFSNFSVINLKIFKFTFKVHIISFYRYKIMSHWRDFYVANAISPLEDVNNHVSHNEKEKQPEVNLEKKYTFSFGKF